MLQGETSAHPDVEQCLCGEALRPCITCAQPRCSRCDPYRSEDCLREIQALSAAAAVAPAQG